MKPAVAFALIVGGVILIALPPVSDHEWRADLAKLLERGSLQVNLQGQMEAPYRFGCYVAGVLMIAAAAVGFSVRRLPPPTTERGATTPP
jgi:hypothetical protein